MKQLFHKLHTRSGFSLAELMITILILLMVAGIIAAGIPAAKEAYVKVVDAANAHVLLSTTMSGLRGELSTAESVSISDSTITYYTNGLSLPSTIKNSDDGITVDDPRGDHLLVSKAMRPNGMRTYYPSAAIINGNIITMNVRVMKSGSIVVEETLTIRLLNDPSGS